MSLAETETDLLPRRAAVAVAEATFPPPAAASFAPPAADVGLWEGRAFSITCLLADAVALAIATLFAAGGLAGLASGSALLLLPPVALLVIATRGMYSWGIGGSPLASLWRVAEAVAIAAMLVVVVTSATGSAEPGVAEAGLAGGLALAGIATGRTLLWAGQRRARVHGASACPTLIVGTGSVGTRVARRLLDDAGYGLRPVGFVDAPFDGLDDGSPECPLPVLGTLADLPEIAARSGARQVIVAFSPSAHDDRMWPLINQCQELGVRVSIVPRMFDALNGRLVYEHIGGLPLLGLRSAPRHGTPLTLKHATDSALAFLFIALLSPVLAAIALAVRLDSPGPVLFRQRRVGLDGREFDVLKFRTMRIDDGPADFRPAAGCAPGGVEGTDRRTPLGRVLRRTSLDELPQLLNVLRGEMSLVGPRPERPEYVDHFAREIPRYGDRLRMRCGLTGWAQVHGLRGQTSLEDRIEWDNYYIEHWSLWLDLKILAMTVAVLLRPDAE